jgi:ParB family transcriptional regulator, chromosome partitioning protein
MSTATDKQRKALGKGLSALLPSRSHAAETQAAPPTPALPTTLPIGAIELNPMQPRRTFQQDRLQELATSIRANGIIQPLIVRRLQNGYQLVAGERRWRAAKLAGLKEVPVVVQDVAEKQLLTIALIENVQREDLNPIELATAYDRLSRELGLSHEEIAAQTGKERATIANTVRLLRLPAEIQKWVAEHRLSMGHAKAILGLYSASDQVQMAQEAISKGMSVRQVEGRIQEILTPRSSREVAAEAAGPKDPNMRAAIENLERVLGTRVRIIESGAQRGRIEIEYYSPAELQRIYQQIAGE